MSHSCSPEMVRRISRRAAAVVVAALTVIGVAHAENPLDLPIGDADRRVRTANVVLDAPVDTRTGETLAASELARRLADTRVLLIGEEHTNSEFHRVQQRVIEALRASGREVLIGLEMFPYTQQAPLDDWTNNRLTEQGFLDKADWYGNWSHHWGYYREIFDYARSHGIKMYGVNLPRSTTSTVRMKGLEALAEADRAKLPPKVDFTNIDHRRLYRAYFESEDPLHGKVPPEQEEAMYRVQVLWDAGMGWNAAKALEAHGGQDAIMVVLIGSGHVAYGLGAKRQLEGQFVGKVSTLIPVSVHDADLAPVRTVRASYADFIWGVPAQLRPDIPVLGVSLAGRLGPNPTKVIHVEKGSAAALAGVQVGDILTSLNGAKLESMSMLQRKMSTYHWGDEAPLELRRGEQALTLPVMFRTVPVASSKPGHKTNKQGR